MTKEEFNELLEQTNSLHDLLKHMKRMIELCKEDEIKYRKEHDFPSEMYNHGAWFVLELYTNKLENILNKKFRG